MKIWRSYGSAHSANITVIGTFARVEDADVARQLVESFLRVDWGDEITVEEWFEEWKPKVPEVQYYGPSRSDFELGIDNEPDISRRGTTVEIGRIRSTQISGFVKLFMLKGATEVRVTGRVGP
jgi:hypothetical protein